MSIIRQEGDFALMASTKVITRGMFFLQNTKTLNASFYFSEGDKNALEVMSKEDFLEKCHDLIKEPETDGQEDTSSEE